MENPSPIERIARLERLVESMTAEMAALRNEIRHGGAASPAESAAAAPSQASGPAQAAGAPQASAPRTAFGREQALRELRGAASAAGGGTEDAASDRRGEKAGRRGTDFRIHSPWTADVVEKAAGRYGMLALATITGLAAVGTFISWAAARVEIGPEAQVGIGLLVAVALAIAGIRLLPRERSFGGVLLGLALAVTHVCAWGAGPAVLGIVPGNAALALALLASAALAIFAHREDDEPLWCAGFGGAAIAPFVTTDGRGSATLLMLYGALVMLAGCWALRGREWNVAGRVLALVGALFLGGLLAAGDGVDGPVRAMALMMGVAAFGVLPFAGERMRRSRLRAFGILAAIAAIAALDIPDPQAAVRSNLPVTWAIVGSIATWLYLVHRTAALPAGSLLDGFVGERGTLWDWVDAAFIPLTLHAALIALGPADPMRVAGTSAAFALAVLALAWPRTDGPLRNAAVFAACAAALNAVWNVGERTGDWQLALMALPAVAFVAANRHLRATPWLPMAAVTLIAVTTGALAQLGDRAAYAYTPFLTVPSFSAMVAIAAWVAASMLCAERAKAFRLGAWIAAFLVVHQELYEAVSPTVSTLLIISYYAVTAVALVGAGRRHANASLRHAGLVMALVAAAAAGRGAARLDAVWAQIVGYLVTSAFLLGLAWWYRRRAGEADEQPSTAATATTVGRND